MAKLTWYQYRFISQYVIAAAFNQPQSQNTINSNRDYDRGIDCLARVLHYNLKGYADLAAQAAVFPGNWNGNQFSTGLDYALQALNLPALYANYATVNSWIADAFDVLPADPSTYGGSSGGSSGGQIDYELLADSIGEALALQLDPIIVRINQPETEFM